MPAACDLRPPCGCFTKHDACLLPAQASLRAEVKRLHDLLHSAHGAKKQWRERALQVPRLAKFHKRLALVTLGLCWQVHA